MNTALGTTRAKVKSLQATLVDFITSTLRLFSPSQLKAYLLRLRTALTSRPKTTTFTTLLAGGAAFLVQDYRAWKSFGTGGTPPTWRGYLKMTRFRLIRLIASFRDDLNDASSLSSDGPQFLKTSLKPRDRPRPQIMPRVLPHRQVPEPITEAAKTRLHGLAKKIQAENPDLLIVAPSKTEGGTTDAIYAVKDLDTLNPIAKDPVLDHEIAHVHHADDSLHVWLADRDARKVIESGWGQRFPLSFVRSGFIMVYAPKDEDEVDAVEAIVKAGVAFITGVDV